MCEKFSKSDDAPCVREFFNNSGGFATKLVHGFAANALHALDSRSGQRIGQVLFKGEIGRKADCQRWRTGFGAYRSRGSLAACACGLDEF
jgi:hypothetical protein